MSVKAAAPPSHTYLHSFIEQSAIYLFSSNSDEPVCLNHDVNASKLVRWSMLCESNRIKTKQKLCD